MELKRNIHSLRILAGESQTPIDLELEHRNVNKMFVYRTMKRYRDTASIAKHNNGGSYCIISGDGSESEYAK